VDKANESLDKVLPDKDADGFRLGPDGNRFSFVFTVSNDLSYGTNWVQIGELLVNYWKAVGVDATLNSMPDTQFVENKKANTVDATIYTGEGGAGITAILDPRYYAPFEYFGMYGNGWFAWRNNTADSVQVEPPDDIKALRDVYQQVLQLPSQEEQIDQMKIVLQNAADEFWVLGIARPGPDYQPYHERLGNFQEGEWIKGWIEGVEKLTYPEQWYIKQ
jgi:peptide/nickel transport system substrate-binding protein